jgi:hypothetical protein
LAAHRAGKVIPGLDPGIIPWRFHRVMLAKASPVTHSSRAMLHREKKKETCMAGSSPRLSGSRDDGVQRRFQ